MDGLEKGASREALRGSALWRDLIRACAISAAIVVLALLPYMLKPEMGLSKGYRGLLLLTSALASPVIELLAQANFGERWFLLTGAVATWLVNALALLLILQAGRWVRRLAHR